MSHDVFICHATHDRDAADAACAALEARGIACWIAPRDLRTGQAYRDAAARALAGCRVVVLIVSGSSAGEPHLGQEAQGAASEGRPLVALRLADVAPAGALGSAMATAQWVDALSPPLATHLDYLGDRVAQVLDGRGPLMPTLPPRPLPPRRARPAYYWLPVAGAGLAGLLAIAAVAMYVAHPPSAEAANERR